MDDFKISFIFSHFIAYHVKNETELGGWPQSGQGAILKSFHNCYKIFFFKSSASYQPAIYIGF